MFSRILSFLMPTHCARTPTQYHPHKSSNTKSNKLSVDADLDLTTPRLGFILTVGHCLKENGRLREHGVLHWGEHEVGGHVNLEEGRLCLVGHGAGKDDRLLLCLLQPQNS